MIGKEQEWCAACSLLSHEHQRDLRAKHLQYDGRFQCGRISENRQALTQSAITDLIVVLQKQDECGRRQVCAARAPRLAMAIGGSLTLIDEPLLEAKREPRSGAIRVISIVSLAFAS